MAASFQTNSILKAAGTESQDVQHHFSEGLGLSRSNGPVYRGGTGGVGEVFLLVLGGGKANKKQKQYRIHETTYKRKFFI